MRQEEHNNVQKYMHLIQEVTIFYSHEDRTHSKTQIKGRCLKKALLQLFSGHEINQSKYSEISTFLK